MHFGTRNAYYLRISAHTVVPLYLYLDERHIEWMSEYVLQHVLADLRPLIMSKLAQEDDTHGPAGGAKKGTLDVHRGDTYQFGYFLRQTEPHAVLIKTRHFVAAPNLPTQASVAKPPSSQPSAGNTKRKRGAPKKKGANPPRTAKKRKTKGKGKANEQEDAVMSISSDDDDDRMTPIETISTPRRSTRQKKPTTGRYNQDHDSDSDESLTIENQDGDVVMELAADTSAVPPASHVNVDYTNLPVTEGGSEDPTAIIVKDEEADPVLVIPPSPILSEDNQMTGLEATSSESNMQEPILIPDEEEKKPKPVLQLRYRNFNIHGRCLCVIVEPWPPLRSASRALSLVPMGLIGPRAPSIAPPDFVPSGAAAAQRARTPLFLPDDDRDRSATPAPSSYRFRPPVPLFNDPPNECANDEDEDNNDGMMELSQILQSVGVYGGTVEDDDDIDGAVLFGDADETREL